MNIIPLPKTDEIYDVNRLQREASHPQHSAWVSASAGSGKTKVLSDRIIRLLLSGVAPQKILCLTFTKAAAAEMSIRLTQRLSKWAICEDQELDKELDELQGHAPEKGQRDRARRLFAQTLVCPGGMRLQTIHSFAQEILCRFPLEAGLAPHFTVLEESEAETLKKNALTDFLQKVAEGHDDQAAKALSILVPALGEMQFVSLLKEVGSKGEKWEAVLKSEGGFENLTSRLREKLELDEKDSEQTLGEQVCREGTFDRVKLLQAGKILLEKGTKTFKEKGQTICTWLEQDETGRQDVFSVYQSVFLTKENTVRDKLANKESLVAFPEIAESLQDEAFRLERFVERLETVQIYQEGVALMLLGARVMEAYTIRKAARAALDYDDLIMRAKALLMRPDIAPWVLFKLDGGIDHILLDEAQDTNPAQWDIVKMLADEFFSGQGARADQERTLFVVGDEKQSIYSFLKADPEEFERRRLYFKDKIEASGKAFKETPLHVSFRSAPAVLRAVDAVFENDKVRQGVSRGPVEHRAYRAAAAGRVEVLNLLQKEEAKEKRKTKEVTPWQLPLDYESASDPAAALSQALAVRIKNWISNGETIFDRKLEIERPIKAGDVMILVRSRGALVDHLVRAFKMNNVPVSGVDRMQLTTQLAVMDLMALMQFTLLPQDDLNLACVLRGPLIGASEAELETLAINRDGTLWQSLLRHSKEKNNFSLWRDYLENLALQSDRLDPLALLLHVLTLPCPADRRGGRRALATRLGPEAEDPIDELLNMAENFTAHKSSSLQAFLQELVSSDVQIKRELEQAMGRVRITTVHGAKGLESPIVILPDTVSVPKSDKLPKILWDVNSGLPFYVPRKPMNGFLSSLFGKAREAQLEEYRRLLYVALTRAADRLIVCGYNTGSDKISEESWYHVVTAGLTPYHQSEILEGRDAFDAPALVLADYVASQVAVLREEDSVAEIQEAPSWLFLPPPEEPLPPRPLVPSRPSEPEPSGAGPQDMRFTRGRLIHKLLQNLPEIPLARRAEVANRFLSNPQHVLSSEQQDEMAREVLDLISHPDFAPLFSPESKAEVPVIGLSGDRLISGQVDRLALVGDEVWIVDYKTNRPPPDDASGISPVYRGQVEAYRTVLKALYPQKTVRCFLLWTYTLRLMEV